MKSDTYTWYQTLIKPSFAPPSWIFGPVWAVLYAVIALSYGTVFYKVFTGKLPWIVALPFVLNLIFNFSFTYFQFGLKNNLLASIDIILVVGTLIWALVSIWQASPDLRWVAYCNLPYLLWGTFATFLQLTITCLNK
ncbi:tryptophan-rich sensory protein [Patescibacteria group bacterium]|nr:tryptophan-rich sensory protein [Patescibacteria group bacterium]